MFSCEKEILYISRNSSIFKLVKSLQRVIVYERITVKNVFLLGKRDNSYIIDQVICHFMWKYIPSTEIRIVFTFITC